jgi:hypothetical protein
MEGRVKGGRGREGNSNQEAEKKNDNEIQWQKGKKGEKSKNKKFLFVFFSFQKENPCCFAFFGKAIKKVSHQLISVRRRLGCFRKSP